MSESPRVAGDHRLTPAALRRIMARAVARAAPDTRAVLRARGRRRGDAGARVLGWADRAALGRGRAGAGPGLRARRQESRRRWSFAAACRAAARPRRAPGAAAARASAAPARRGHGPRTRRSPRRCCAACRASPFR
ncbi:MAG: hypothetical protein MZW92_59715 [Comamonadaceae bacterium]|nr:hypothetical protein [Comamonadaceae bacterium]